MKKIILIVFLICSIFVNANSSTSSKVKIHPSLNNTEYFNQFSNGIVEFISTGEFTKIEQMFGDSGVYGADCAIDSCNIYNSPLTSSELKDQFTRILTEKTTNVTVIRNTNSHYTTETFTHGTMFKFEVIYNETGRVDDFMVYVDYNGKLLNVTTNTTINIKGYFDGHTLEFRGNRNVY